MAIIAILNIIPSSVPLAVTDVHVRGKRMFAIKLAGTPIAVEATHPRVKRLFNDYLADIPVENCAFQVAVINDEVASMKEQLAREEAHHAKPFQAGTINPEYCEFLALYVKICDRLLDYDTLFMHAAVIEHKGFAYAFTAPSGTGKSTHIKLWLDNCKDAIKIINGDKPLIRMENDRFIVYGSPLKGKEGWGMNTSAPLKAICFVERSDQDHLEPLNNESVIIKKLSSQLHYPSGQSAAEHQLELLDKLIRKVRFFTLKCTPNPSAFNEAFKMTKICNE